MNLEQIDTSTTAGKAEVMRLAAEGRRVAFRCGAPARWYESPNSAWDWFTYDYAIISEPVGPEELFVCIARNGVITATVENEEQGIRYEQDFGGSITRYIRADLAGEVKP